MLPTFIHYINSIGYSVRMSITALECCQFIFQTLHTRSRGPFEIRTIFIVTHHKLHRFSLMINRERCTCIVKLFRNLSHNFQTDTMEVLENNLSLNNTVLKLHFRLQQIWFIRKKKITKHVVITKN